MLKGGVNTNKKTIIIVSVVFFLLAAVIISILVITKNKYSEVTFNDVLMDDLKITISGTIKNAAVNEDVTITVYEKGKDSDDLSAIIYLDQKTVEADGTNGKFEFSFMMPEKSRGKSYNVKIGSTSLDKSVVYDKVISIK